MIRESGSTVLVERSAGVTPCTELCLYSVCGIKIRSSGRQPFAALSSNRHQPCHSSALQVLPSQHRNSKQTNHNPHKPSPGPHKPSSTSSNRTRRGCSSRRGRSGRRDQPRRRSSGHGPVSSRSNRRIVDTAGPRLQRQTRTRDGTRLQ